MPFIETGNFRGQAVKISTDENADGNTSPRYGFSDAATALVQSLLTALQKIAPATEHAAVTPNDSTILTGVRALYIGTGGNIVVTVGGTDQPYVVSDGATLLVEATKVKATGTDASNIIAWKG